jgi:hypothetical protein
MGFVPTIRINLSAPFPALVTGSGPITVGKVNGIWVLGASGDLIGAANPGLVATDFVLVWDSVAKGWVKVSLSNLITQAQATRLQRSVTASPIVIGVNDQMLNINIAAGAPTCALPQASTRAGSPLTFKDVGGQAGAHPITITPFAGDSIDGAANYTLFSPRQEVTLVPFNDTVNTGWFVS